MHQSPTSITFIKKIDNVQAVAGFMEELTTSTQEIGSSMTVITERTETIADIAYLREIANVAKHFKDGENVLTK